MSDKGPDYEITDRQLLVGAVLVWITGFTAGLTLARVFGV